MEEDGSLPGTNPNDVDDAFVRSLTAFDERLVRGESSHPPAGADDSVDAPVSLPGDADVVGAHACLAFLERAFPRGGLATEPPALERIGRFELLRVLGQGGFGVVYLVRDPRLDRLVALKLPRLHTLGSDVLQERFLREARAAAALDHPHIVPILETGEIGPVCYIASAYCEGTDLEQWLRTNAPVAPRLAARIVEVLAEAARYSHAHGVLHRDLKPSNVLLGVGTEPRTTGADELPFVPRLTDFGLARFAEQAAGETGSAVIGTPLYMAPEQAAGQSEHVCAATDVYALGAILYELLTGRPPFQGTGVLEVLEQIRLTDPVPPGRLVKSIPRDLETICLKCLLKEPAHRYDTAQALLDDLRAFLQGRAITARPAGAIERSIKWVRRRPLAATSLAVVMAALALIVGLQWKHARILAENLRTTDSLRLEALAREAELRLTHNAAEIHAAEYELTHGGLGSADRALGRIADVRKGIPPGRFEPPGLAPEWGFVTRQIEFPPPAGVFADHAAAVYSVTVAPDGRWAASGDARGMIRIWEVETTRQIACFSAHDGEVRALAFSPQGDRLASGGQFSLLKLWNTTDWKLLASVDAHDGTVTCLDWRRDGLQLASGGRDGMIRLSHGATLDSERVMAAGDVVNRVRYAVDGSSLYSSDKGRSVSKWQLGGPHSSRIELLKTDSNPLSLDISDEDGFGVTADTTFFTTGSKRFHASAYSKCHACVVAGKANWAATGGGEGDIDLWRWRTSPLEDVSQQRWYGHGTKGISDCAATPDGNRLLTAGLDGAVKVWRVGDFTQPGRQWIGGHSAQVRGLAFSPDSRFVASAGDDGRICVYETRDGRRIDLLDVGRDIPCRTPQFAVDGATLSVVANKPDGGLIVWRPGASSPHRFVPVPGIVSSSVVSDTRLALALSAASGVVLWDTDSEKVVRQVIDAPLKYSIVEASPHGHLLATKVQDAANDSVVIVDLATGKGREIPGTGGWINCMAFDHKGQRLAIVLAGHLLLLVDTNSSLTTDRFHLSERTLEIDSISFSPDGQTIAVASREIGRHDGIVQLLHLGARRTTISLDPFGFGVSTVRFSPDGRILAATTAQPDADGNAGIVLWRFDPPRAAPQ